MTTSPSSSAQQARRALGTRLRDLRKDADLTARELAQQTGQHYTRVWKIENGIQPPTDQDIRDWCRACRADGHVLDLIATLRVVDSAYREFRRQSRAGLKRVLGAPNDLEEAVAVRQERQRVLKRGGKRFVTVLEEQALRTWLGDAEIQAGQLGRLLELMARSAVRGGSGPG
ncbi:Scr1 family TA system antitoxin-like transcriptional regulator [Nocardia sp. NPDC059240]|uniref:Scr1 family TA system antitoxin-like transcriptional regulator n=1 Tax=Nocardia sp. NPDC059240 TaxID=3346786 RepID=UPI00369E8930